MILSNVEATEHVETWTPPNFLKSTESNGIVTAQFKTPGDGNTDRSESYWLEKIERARSEGYQLGRSDAERDFGEESSAEKMCLLELMRQLEAPIHRLNESVFEELLELGKALAKTIIKREIATDAQFYRDLLIQALSDCQAQVSNATVRMNPQDVALVESVMTDGMSANLPHPIADNRLERGSCLIETDQSYIDVGVDSLLSLAMASAQTPTLNQINCG